MKLAFIYIMRFVYLSRIFYRRTNALLMMYKYLIFFNYHRNDKFKYDIEKHLVKNYKTVYILSIVNIFKILNLL